MEGTVNTEIRGWNITPTTTQVQEAIKQSRNNRSQGPDKLNVRHIGPLGLAFLTSMFKTALNTNIIPHIWKANISPILNKASRRRPFILHLHCRLITTQAPVQVMSYADDMAITSTHTSTGAAKTCIQHTYIKFGLDKT